jgi:hypothetical protein
MTLAMKYFISIILSATKTCFQLIPEIMTDSKLKKHPEVFNLSTALLSQSKSIYLCSLILSPEKNHIQLYHASLPPTRTSLASTKYRIRVITTKKISGLALTRYIEDPIYCLYIMGSTKYESKVESLNLFGFVSMLAIHHIETH